MEPTIFSMFVPRRKMAAAIFLVLVLTLTAVASTGETPKEGFETEKAKVLSFLEDVIGINVGDCQVSSRFFDDNKIYPGHTAVVGGVTLTRGDTKVTASFSFIDGVLTWFVPRVTGEVKPKFQYSGDASAIVNVARGLLDRYKAAFNVSYCDEFRPLLDEVDTSHTLDKAQSMVRENVKFTVEEKGGGIKFSWTYTFNGMVAGWKTLSFSFEDGFLRAFGDRWGVTKIGSTAVKISKEEAIRIAKETAKSYVQSIGAKIGRVETSLDLDKYMVLGDEGPESGRGDCLTLYPRWHVMMHFDRVYPGNVDGYSVFLWADTGEVYHHDPQGFYGEPPPLLNPTILVIVLALPLLLAIVITRNRKAKIRAKSATRLRPGRR